MSASSKFLQSLIVLATTLPPAVAAAAPAPVAETVISGRVDFASNLPAKVAGSPIIANGDFAQVWSEVTFARIKYPPPPPPNLTASAASPAEVFASLND